MKQALHIFAKDARHFWPEILVSLAITTAFAWVYPANWPARMGETEAFLGAIILLVPVGWVILIARVVHDESLVGDRQFWITRPYRWTELLAAKAIFLLVFLYLPILIAQCALLYRAGFVPFGFVRGLLFNLWLLSCILVLPLFAIATVTATFARMAVTLLGVLVAVIGFRVAGNGDITFWGSGVPFISAIAAAIFLQYAARRTLASRLLLIGMVVAMIAAGKLLPKGWNVLRDYPRLASSDHPPVQLRVDPDSLAIATKAVRSNDVFLHIPLVVSGMASGTAIKTDHLMATIEAPNGLRWTSQWQSNYPATYLSNTRSSVQLTVDRSFYDKVKSMPLTVRLTFALTELRSGRAITVPVAAGDFSVPDFGICTLVSHNNNALVCRFPMRPPHLSLLNSPRSKMPCSQGPSGEPADIQDQVQGQFWIGDLRRNPADFGIAPISVLDIFFSNGNYWLCPGSPLTVTRYEMAGRTQTDLTVTGLQVTE